MTCGNCGCSPCSCGPSFSTCGQTETFAGSGCVSNCQNTTPGNPAPYYSGCGACPEDHTKTLIEQSYSFSARVQDRWNVPACGRTTVVTVPGADTITVGGYLWNPTYGYFQITAFNATLHQVTLANNCTDGNASAGTPVPACTDFNVSPPPCTCSNAQPDLFPYLALDFTAPNNGACTSITVTNVNGLIAGKDVEIAGGTYNLSSIDSGTVVTICNNGDGLTPGTPVLALDASGNFQYPIILVDGNPCTNDDVTTGVVLVCDSSNQVPLSSAIPGGVDPDCIVAVAVIDAGTTIASYVPVDANIRTCSTLSQILTIVNGTANYTLNIDDNVFLVNDVLNVHGRLELFTVTGVGSGTVNVTAVPTPGANGTVPLGSWVCVQTCCDAIVSDVTSLQTDVAALQVDVAAIQQSWVQLLDQVAELAVTNTAAETTLYTFTVTGGSIGAIRLRMGYSVLNNTGGLAISLYQVYYGGTVILTDLHSYADSADVYFHDMDIVLGDRGAPNVQYATGTIRHASTPQSRNNGLFSTSATEVALGASAVDSTVAQIFKVTVTMGSASAAYQTIRESATLELLNE